MTDPDDTRILADHGAWPSPLGIDDVLTAGVGLGSVQADGDAAYWLESLPDQDNRTTVVRWAEGRCTELTPGAAVLSRVQEYGGGAYHVRDGVLVFCDDLDHQVKVLDADRPRPLTPADPRLRFGDLRVHPDRDLVLAVREDHRGEGEAVTTIVALDLSGGEQEGTVLVGGADFYANPELSADGRLAWMEWNHPDMPWDRCRVLVAGLTAGGDQQLGEPVVVSGRVDTSAVRPVWDAGSGLLLLLDRTGYWNPWRWDGRTLTPLVRSPHDFCLAPWVLGNHEYAVLDAGRVLCHWYDSGMAGLGVLSPDTGDLTRVDAGQLADVDSVAGSNGVGWAIVSRPDSPDEVIRIGTDGAVTVVRRAGQARPDPAATSVPESLLIQGDHGTFQAWFYPPMSATHRAPAGRLPPLIVKSHGGPTGFASCGYDTGKQFWTSRGFAILDVNYSGSAGFGRQYRNRLYGAWGQADRDDCVAAVADVAQRGLVDPARVVITGGSAGGYTTLRCLTTSDVFAAGVSSYGVGDLELLATDTHKFESRYLDHIVGRYPEQRALYLERSPIHHLDALSSPMLILQGLADRIVPPNQAEEMARAVRAKGLAVALVMFEGEGHGFRRLETRRAVLESQLSFFAQLFGFVPADRVPVLPIENLATARAGQTPGR